MVHHGSGAAHKSLSAFFFRLQFRSNDAPSDLRPQTTDPAPMMQRRTRFPAAEPHKKSAKGGTAPLNSQL